MKMSIFCIFMLSLAIRQGHLKYSTRKQVVKRKLSQILYYSQDVVSVYFPTGLITSNNLSEIPVQSK